MNGPWRGMALAALGCIALAGCRLWDRRPDVVLIVLDAARADHLSAYGYDRPTTPHIDPLAAEGVLYRRAIAPGTWTVPSHASLFTGRLPTAHGAHHVAAPDPNATSALASGYDALVAATPAIPPGPVVVPDERLGKRLRALGYIQ